MKLVDHGIAELEEKYNYILDNISNNQYYDVDEIVNDLFEEAKIDGTLTFSSFKANEEIYENYNFVEVCTILSDMGVDLNNLERNKVYDELVHIMLSEYETGKYFNEVYESMDYQFGDLLSDKEKLVATIYEISKEHELDFAKNIDNKIYENVVKKAIDNDIWYIGDAVKGLEDNEEIAKFILQIDPENIEYISDRLKEDHEFLEEIEEKQSSWIHKDSDELER